MAVAWTEFTPANLRRSFHDGAGNLRPSVVTDQYLGGDPAAAGDLKPSIIDSAGNVRAGLIEGSSLKASVAPPKA